MTHASNACVRNYSTNTGLGSALFTILKKEMITFYLPLAVVSTMSTPTTTTSKTIKRLTGPLPKKKFGNTSMHVTEVCAGTMTWGSFVETEESAHAELDKFLSLGVNFLDTAEIYPVAFNYGKTTEMWIGNWLSKQLQSKAIPSREEYYIATKCNAAGIGSPDGEGHNYSKEKLEASARASIERLQCSYIDLYYIHFPSRKGFNVFGWGTYGSPSRYEDTKTSMGDMADFERQVLGIKHLYDLGLIKNWGLSNEDAYGVTMFCIAADKLGVPRPCCIQNDLSMNDRTFECDVAEACHYFGVVGLPYGALSGGTLTGKYLNGQDTPNSRHNRSPEFQTRYNCALATEATKEYVALAKEWGLTPTELAIAWARDREYNFGVITGTTSPKQVEECVGAFQLEPLPEELNAAVDLIHEQYRSPNAAFANKDEHLKAAWLTKE